MRDWVNSPTRQEVGFVGSVGQSVPPTLMMMVGSAGRSALAHTTATAGVLRRLALLKPPYLPQRKESPRETRGLTIFNRSLRRSHGTVITAEKGTCPSGLSATNAAIPVRLKRTPRRRRFARNQRP